MARNLLRGIDRIMSFEMQGLSEFQRDLLKVANKRLPKETKKVMRKAGSKARTHVARKARSKVKKKTGNYHKKFKRGKVFVNKNGETVVRIINSSPHAHLIEYGYRQVVQNGRKDKDKDYRAYKRAGEEVGFVRGQHIVREGMDDFDNSGQYEGILSDWLDQLLKDGKL